ncbi:hypothetical protein MRB53_037394 [Persea americana]|nr:hypothetical protein MRB53_037394 [Persea americana]
MSKYWPARKSTWSGGNTQPDTCQRKESAESNEKARHCNDYNRLYWHTAFCSSNSERPHPGKAIRHGPIRLSTLSTTRVGVRSDSWKQERQAWWSARQELGFAIPGAAKALKRQIVAGASFRHDDLFSCWPRPGSSGLNSMSIAAAGVSSCKEKRGSRNSHSLYMQLLSQAIKVLDHLGAPATRRSHQCWSSLAAFFLGSVCTILIVGCRISTQWP